MLSVEQVDGSHTLVTDVLAILLGHPHTRFASLQELELVGLATFQGQGATLEQRTASMQRQLAALCAPDNPHPLAPPSWPIHSALISVNLQNLYPPPDPDADEEQPMILNDPPFLSTLQAALQTPSLHTLTAAITPTAAPHLSHLSHLTSLTSLALSCHTAPDPTPILQTLRSISWLESLHLTIAPDPNPPALLHLSPTFSHLTRLTRFHLETAARKCFMAATLLPHLPLSLQYLQLQLQPEACLSSLYRLTALRSLDVYSTSDITMDEEYEYDAMWAYMTDDAPRVLAQAAGSPPQSWASGMTYFSWLNYSDIGGSINAATLQHMTNLSSLTLCAVAVTPALCRVLGMLPLLDTLALLGAYAPSTPPFEGEQRTLLPLMKRLQMRCTESDVPSGMMADALHLLACWTDLNDSSEAIFDISWDTVALPVVSIGGWGCGWAEHGLHCLSEEKILLLLADDKDIDQYIARVLASGTSAKFVLGAGVTAHGLARLVRAHVPRTYGCVEVLEKDVPRFRHGEFGWRGRLQRWPELLAALAESGPFFELTEFRAHLACAHFNDDCVALLAEVAPQLQSVVLDGPAVTAAGLLVLVLRCRQLKSIGVGRTCMQPVMMKAVLENSERNLRSVWFSNSYNEHGEQWRVAMQQYAGCWLSQNGWKVDREHLQRR